MTDLQIKHWQAQETARHNRAEETLLPSKIALQESQVHLTDEQATLARNEAEKVLHDIELIDAKTDLTKVEKDKAINEIVQGYINSTANLVGSVGKAAGGLAAFGAL